MKLNAYSIFDSASGAYTRPFFMPADAQAVRSFRDIALDADHEIGKHPDDYRLVRCGVWDDNTCVFVPEEISVIAKAWELVAESRQVNRAQIEALEERVN